jgi:hypothetical protein
MEPLWGIEDVSKYLRIPVQTLYKWRNTNYGPRGRKIGKYVRYEPQDVRAWFLSISTEVA